MARNPGGLMPNTPNANKFSLNIFVFTKNSLRVTWSIQNNLLISGNSSWIGGTTDNRAEMARDKKLELTSSAKHGRRTRSSSARRPESSQVRDRRECQSQSFDWRESQRKAFEALLKQKKSMKKSEKPGFWNKTVVYKKSRISNLWLANERRAKHCRATAEKVSR